MSASASTPTRSRQLVAASSARVRLEAARAWLRAFPRDREVLILVPHSIAADHLVHALAAESGPRFGIQRLTLNRFAAHLAVPELARRQVLPCTDLSLAAVITRAVHRVIEEGKAGRLAKVAKRPGFPRAIARTFKDLRAANITCNRVKTDPDAAPLAPFLDRIGAELTENRLADRAEIFMIAMQVIARRAASFTALPVLLLDLSLSEVLERHFVAAILAHSVNTFATAEAGDRPAINALTDLLGVGPTVSGRDEPDNSLANLQHHLFENSKPAVRPLDASVSLASWPGETRECVEITRRMQAEAANGVPFDRMAIFLRAPALYRSHMEEALRRAAIPAWFARGSTRPDPSGRALLALLACAAEGYTARRFAEYLSLSQVPPRGVAAEEVWVPPEEELLPVASQPEEGAARTSDVPKGQDLDPDGPTLEGTLRAPWRWERLLVDAAVIGGPDRWRRRLAGLAEEIALRRSELEEDDTRADALASTASDLSHLTSFALPLIEQLAALPHEARWADWLERLKELAVAALRQPTGVLRVLAELDPLGPVGPVRLMAVRHVLTRRLSDLAVPPDSRPNGAVFVAPIEMARGLSFEVVFVPGLAENLFPQRVLQDPLLSDRARESLGTTALATQALRVGQERLALRLAASAAQRHLALSWPRIELERARPRVPSFYALEALRAAEGKLPGLDELTRRAESGHAAHLGWPAPDHPEDAIDGTEYDLATLAHLKSADPDESVGAAAYLLSSNVHLARALRARGRRWKSGWWAVDGLVDPDSEVLAVLARHKLGDRAYSITALETFAACPYRFLLQAIHQLRPRDDIEALETLDPLTRGALIHQVQFRVLDALRAAKLLPVNAQSLDWALEHLDRAVLQVASEYRERLAPAIARVWEDGVDAIRLNLREWLRRMAAEGGEWTPIHFELAFGLPEHLRPEADPGSVREPVRVLDRALLRGSIDLIERRSDGTLRVTDHKSGKIGVPEDAKVAGGQVLQPVLYALVAERIFTKPVQSGGLYYCTADGEFTHRRIPLDATTRKYAERVLETIGRAIEQGFLPAAPLKDACDACNYRVVCGPHEHYRASRKRQDRLADLHALRALK